MVQNDQQTIAYYLDELSYLRERGREFAQRYPAIGAQLDLTAGRPADPHVERLIESFAFLTGRLQQQLDAGFPRISSALLAQLYPPLATIVPPLTIACFEADLEHGKWTTGCRIEAGTALWARQRDEAPCRFRTCYPVTLWPVEVQDVSWATPQANVVTNAGIRLQLRCADPGFQSLGVGSLRFYLDGHAEQTGPLYDLLASQVTGVLWSNGEQIQRMGPETLRLVGFHPSEAVLVHPEPAHAGYRLLQEYFYFPRKFHFFDLDVPPGFGARATVQILLRELAPGPQRLTAASFRLGCTPAINLFPRSSEPLRVDHRRHEYRLVADYRREASTEIHSILSVTDSVNPSAATRRVEPLYSRRWNQPGEARVFWQARREWRVRNGVPGTDIHLSFVDRDFTPTQPSAATVFAELLCTNRGLAAELPAGAALETDQMLPARAIVALFRPTPPGYPRLGGAAMWPLISSLSLNHLSLGGEAGLEALREVLRLYSPEDRPAVRRPIDGISALECRRVSRHIGRDAWRGHRHGLEARLVLETEGQHFVGSSAALLAAVLRHFLALHAAVNSFVEVTARRSHEEEDWLSWPALAGSQPLL
jgi:type VI secretion system protein ImpG